MKIIPVISIRAAENVDLLLEGVQYCRRCVVKPRIYFGILLPHAASCIINPTVFRGETFLYFCFVETVELVGKVLIET